ncbi:hypothetical protein [Methylobacterium oryzisoli]|uniref:hypothetical protein n=1 Tax=Methylobacterium oryzisoli TaxID=3385502 RepID=UPI0038926821
MTTTTLCAGLGLLALTLSAPALAQGTPAQQQACTPDAMSLCGEHIPDGARVKACLKSKRSSLSPACRAAIASEDPQPRRQRGQS